MDSDNYVYKTAADYAYRQLRRLIFKKKLLPGQRLTETSLANALETSRTPIREALRRLESEGLVNITPNSGATLVSPTKEEVYDTYEVRKHLEVMSVRKASRIITPEQLAKLRELLAIEKESYATEDYELFMQAVPYFHITIAEASGNSVLKAYIENVLSLSFVQLALFDTFFDFDSNPSIKEHTEIYKALEKHDEELCAELMAKHIYLSKNCMRSTDEPDGS